VRILLVLLGGGIGSVARYLTSTGMAERFGSSFPLGTLTVNIAGSVLIGFLATLADERGILAPEPRLFLVVGVLGGFTTFSSFSLETLRLAQAGAVAGAMANIGLNVLLSLVAVVIGVGLGRMVFR
jgi:fluoride exporter